MSCKICNVAATKEDPITVCDHCKIKLCQDCAKISSTEYRAVTMKSRVIVYYCFTCRPSLVNISETLGRQIKAVFSTEVESLADRITGLSDQVKILCEGSEGIAKILDQRLVTSSTCGQTGQLDSDTLFAKLYTELSRTFNVKFEQMDRNIGDVRALFRPASDGSAISGHPDNKGRCRTSLRPASSDSVTSEHLEGEPQPKTINPGKNSVPKVGNSNRPLVGTKVSEKGKLSAAVICPRVNIQVRKLDSDTTEDILSDYLVSTFGAEKYLIEKLNVKSGEYASYRVSANAALKNELTNPVNWPEGVEIFPLSSYAANNFQGGNYSFQRNRYRSFRGGGARQDWNGRDNFDREFSRGRFGSFRGNFRRN